MLLSLVFSLLAGVDWSQIKTNDNISLIYDPAKWEKPQLVEGVNTLGWEDSVQVNWNGDHLIYLYMRLDLGRLLDPNPSLNIDLDGDGLPEKIRIHTPPREGYSSDKTADYASDLFEANSTPGGWVVKRIAEPVNTLGGLEGSAQLTEDRRTIFFNRSWTDPVKGSQKGSFWAVRDSVTSAWRTPQLLPRPVIRTSLSSNTSDNLFLVGNRLYWEEIVTNQRLNIFSTAWPIRNTWWSSAVATPFSQINSVDDDTQIWSNPTGQEFMFCRNHMVIYRWLSNVGMVQPEALIASGAVQGNANAGGLGEPSMDKNGNLYFLYVWKAIDPSTNLPEYDADIVRMRRK